MKRSPLGPAKENLIFNHQCLFDEGLLARDQGIRTNRQGKNRMIKKAVHIEVMPLRVPLNLTFRHAGASRSEGKSVWVKAERNGVKGFGEGCPRDYVAGDDLESSIRWIQKKFSNGGARFDTFDDVRNWTEKNSAIIDSYPSAWCAVELALLDLLAREENRTVETLLGIDGRLRQGRYTAILGDDKEWKFTIFVDRYLVLGFTDFKIKLHGDLQVDLAKLAILKELGCQHGVTDLRVRLDANNLWSGRSEDAITHLAALHETTENLFAVEEPVGPRDVAGVSRVSLALGLPVILDESLCTSGDLALFANLPGEFIANIKLSKTGGLIRALGLIEALKKKGWPIIMGCHVGETSILTRAALTSAHAAGKTLIAQEGAFGDYLVAREPVSPSLKFGRQGLLDLSRPYFLDTVQGMRVVPVENWSVGFGIEGRMPVPPDDGHPELLVLEMADRYKIHSRVWGEAEGEDALLVLHGGMSHSGWQAPLANALRSLSRDISIVAPDRRGCGLNEKRGDLGSVNLVIGDVVTYVEFLRKSFKRVYLAGWGQGAQYASIAAVKMGDALSGLALLAPGFFWNERFRSVISIAEKIVLDMIDEFELSPGRDQAYVPVPMEPTDFTLLPEWLDFIANDELKTTMVTMKTVNIMGAVQELSWSAILQNRLPLLAILAENDRIVDNFKVRQFIGHMFPEKRQNRLVTLDTGHAMHFEKPLETARELLHFIKTQTS